MSNLRQVEVQVPRPFLGQALLMAGPPAPPRDVDYLATANTGTSPEMSGVVRAMLDADHDNKSWGKRLDGELPFQIIHPRLIGGKRSV